MKADRRAFVQGLAALGMAQVAGNSLASVSRRRGRVVVVGGGFGGATAARYLQLWAPFLEVTLVERQQQYVSCPVSNLVLGGSKQMADITQSYASLKQRGVNVVRGEAIAIDAEKRFVRLEGGRHLPYDRVIVSPGIDFMYDAIPGLNNKEAQTQILHAWKAGTQTLALRKQIESMFDGGVMAIVIPEVPFRCPPGPYERACQIAHYFKRAKPKSKLLLLDANADIASKPALFKAAFTERYADVIEYQPNTKLVDMDIRRMTAKMEFEDIKADVFNVLPPMKAGAIAEPFITANQRWCEVDWLTYEAKNVSGVHLLGDALQIAPGMPKSGHMANAQAKTCAAAVIALLAGDTPNPAPTLINTCYSFVSPDQAVHIASVHKYDNDEKTMKPVPGSGGMSKAASELEAQYGLSWAKNIWADSFG